MPHRKRRRFRVYTREVMVRLSSFKGPIILFFVGVVVGAMLLRQRYHLGIIESVYQAVTLMFFASTLEYPRGDPFYEILWICFPLFGLLMLAQSLEGIGSAIKFGDPTSEEWNREVTKIMEDHIIVVGIGNLGIRVLDELIAKGAEVVMVDLVTDHIQKSLLEHYQRSHRIPLVQGDAQLEHVLLQAGVDKARAMMLLVDDDLINLKVATKARKLAPRIKLILRMFDLDFGEELASKLKFSLFSTTKIAVNAFIKDLGLPAVKPNEGTDQGTYSDALESADV